MKNNTTTAMPVMILSLVFVLISYFVIWPSLYSAQYEPVAPNMASYDQELTYDQIVDMNQTIITLHINPGFASSDKINVQIGTTITWINDDIVSHSIISKTAAFDSGIIEPGRKFSYTFTDSGTYKYFCDIDPSVESEVIVR